jgi:RNA polymerase sigma-70 factor (ECF subfamily)
MNGPDGDAQDAQDMSRLVNGHEAALNDLMERHAERLFHYLFRSLQNEDDAADLAQETFVKVYQNRAKFDPSQKFTVWLYAIASNLVKDRYRWRSRHPQASLDIENEGTGATLEDNLRDTKLGPDETLQKEESAEAVRKAVAALPEELRQALVLSVYQELPQAEIAAILKCSVKAVETRIYRARQQLRSSLGSLVAAS